MFEVFSHVVYFQFFPFTPSVFHNAHTTFSRSPLLDWAADPRSVESHLKTRSMLC